MKPLLEIGFGLVLSLGMFIIGLAAATLLLTAEPVRQPGPGIDVADLWTAEPRRVDTAAQSFERLPAVHVPSDPNPSDETKSADTRMATLDTTETASVALESADQQTQSDSFAAHVQWCASRYRSYRQEDNNYTRYDGVTWPCVSPYSRDLVVEVDGAATPLDAVDYAVEGDRTSLPWLQASGEPEQASYLAADHETYCFSRYRSYRPEDNTYQPYGGGPRRECILQR